jgi:hypothetical protein
MSTCPGHGVVLFLGKPNGTAMPTERLAEVGIATAALSVQLVK